MRNLILIFAISILASCTQKYQKYDVIHKASFKKDEGHNPITPRMMPANFEDREVCEGQIFFNKNAKDLTDKTLPRLIQYMCHDSDYLLNAKITETWWTTIIYSRSCVTIEASCPHKFRN